MSDGSATDSIHVAAAIQGEGTFLHCLSSVRWWQQLVGELLKVSSGSAAVSIHGARRHAGRGNEFKPPETVYPNLG
eukprot:16339593-Heterocapsa_arctica.AAC.1